MDNPQFITSKSHLDGDTTTVAAATQPVKWLLLVIHSWGGSNQAA
jgi:hypothetical protein